MPNRSNIIEYFLNFFRKPFLVFFIFLRLKPNLITMLGSICGILGLYFLTYKNHGYISILLIFLYLVFDMVDGDIARNFKITSKSGAFLDIFFDKIILAGLLIIFLFKLLENNNLDLNKYLITFLCFSPMLSQYFLLVIIYLNNKKSLSKNKSSLTSNSVQLNFLKNIYEIFFFPTQIYIISLISLGIVFNYEIQIFYFVSSITLISIIRQLYIGFNKLN